MLHYRPFDFWRDGQEVNTDLRFSPFFTIGIYHCSILSILYSRVVNCFFKLHFSMTQQSPETTTTSLSFVFLGYARSTKLNDLIITPLFDIVDLERRLLHWFRRRFHQRSPPDSHWLSKFLTMYWFLVRWLCVETTKICCREKLGCMNTQCCSALERWESHHHASKMN